MSNIFEGRLGIWRSMSQIRNTTPYGVDEGLYSLGPAVFLSDIPFRWHLDFTDRAGFAPCEIMLWMMFGQVLSNGDSGEMCWSTPHARTFRSEYFYGMNYARSLVPASVQLTSYVGRIDFADFTDTEPRGKLAALHAAAGWNMAIDVAATVAHDDPVSGPLVEVNRILRSCGVNMGVEPWPTMNSLAGAMDWPAYVLLSKVRELFEIRRKAIKQGDPPSASPWCRDHVSPEWLRGPVVILVGDEQSINPAELAGWLREFPDWRVLIPTEISEPTWRALLAAGEQSA